MLIKNIAKQILSGVAAGLLITIGCCVYLGCDAKGVSWVGAILFSVALLSICLMNFSLFTGRIGFLLENLKKDYISGLLLGLLGNVIATAVVGIAVQYAIPNLHDTAAAMCALKLDQQLWQTFIRGILCGVLMYIAVGVYKYKKSVLGIVFCIPAFILSGFEHSIADMGYFAIAGIYSAQAFGFICIVILGNAVGALLIPLGAMLVKDKRSESAESAKVTDISSVPQAESEAECNVEAACDVSEESGAEIAKVNCDNASISDRDKVQNDGERVDL